MWKQISRSLSTSLLRQAKYGGRHTAVCIPGDGIGLEMSRHMKQVFKLIQAPVDFETIEWNDQDAAASDAKLAYAIQAVKRTGVCIKGNITTNLADHNKPRNQKMRADLDIFANVIHAKSFNSVETKHKDIDIYLVRENTEGEYAGLEHESIPGVVESLKIMTRPNVERIARFAFDFARSHGRKKVTCVHKANIMKQGDGLFLRVCGEVAKDYPDIEFNDMIVDNTCMQLVSNPWQFDVMVLPNLYGNIVGNVCCGLVGGPGLTAGSNYSDSTTMTSSKNGVGIFEMATRNTGVSIMDQNMANPTAFLMAGVKMLEYLELYKHANIIRRGIDRTLNEDLIHTPDLGGNHKTTDFMAQLNDNIKSELKDDITFEQD